MSKPLATVYPEYHKEGVRFQLYNNGAVTARTKDLPEREVFCLSSKDDGKPWVPSHKNFNALCRESFREGDVDDLIARQRRISEARGLKRKHGEELFEALEAAMRFIDSLAADPDINEAMIEAHRALYRLEPHSILAKARGEQT